ncbi:Serine/threonine-protein kinase Nek4 [Cucumispora dikerogammari]|nr:Serine/threonine-protein kinase Nek4 [Cucumispora dikerogammari]
MEQYKFISKLGSGTHGCVYLVRKHKETDFLVCKSYFKKYNKYAKKEIDILQSVKHKNIISYRRAEIHDNNYFIFLDYVNYGCLDGLMEFFKNKYLSHKPIISIFAQIINGLYYLHKKGIVHRDIKPSNILLSKNENSGLLEVKICDFSLSTFKKDMTQSVVGTPYYIAPEIIKKMDYDYTVDVWSLGVCMYEFVAKKRPFEGANKLELKRHILTQTIDRVPNCKNGFLERIILSCLRKENRVTSAYLRNLDRFLLHINYIEMKNKQCESGKLLKKRDVVSKCD